METHARKGFARPVIVALWTGEEKGLHGSEWFVAHPTIPLEKVAANINLDQPRPIFPLELMTTLSLNAICSTAARKSTANGIALAITGRRMTQPS